MSLAFGFALPHWQPLSGGFSPASLFAGGTAGAWYDPSDLTTLFTTSVGTTQCAMPGQGAPVPVGLMLDKSQGLVLGSELITPVANQDFSSDTGYWTKGVGVTISGGAANFSAASGYALYRISVLPVGAPGAYYEVTFTVTNYVSGSIRPYLGTSPTFGTAVSANGTYTQRFCPTSGGEVGFNANVAFTGSIDNVSIKQVLGNHAIAFNDTTARPELRARVNLLTYSEEFDNGAWAKNALNTTGTPAWVNAAVAPNGTTTADLLLDTTTNAEHYAQQSFSCISGVSYTFSGYVKQYTYTTCVIRTWLTGSIVHSVDFSAGTISGGGTLISVGNGWYRFEITRTASATGTAYIESYVKQTGSYVGTGTDGHYVWGFDVRPANIGANVPAYQRIADANTYDTSGFPLYLRFDGVDDSMYTPANLNLSGTDKVAVFAGVRKLSASTGFVAETSAAAESNNGAFRVGTDSGGIEYFISSRGTTSQQVNVDNAAYTSPVTNVVQSSFDIAAPLVSVRINGAAVGSNSGSQGTGNFGTYPLYVGSRNNASFRFDGQIYSLIVVGSAVSAGNISATEQWVAQKTGLALP